MGDEVEELMTKARQLETELDLTNEKFGFVSIALDEKEKTLAATELEMAALNRRVPAWRKTWRRPRRRWWQLSANLTRLRLLLTTLRGPRRFSRAKLMRMRRGLLLWRRT